MDPVEEGFGGAPHVELARALAVLPRALDSKLQAAGANYYVRKSDSLPIGPDEVLIRLVTSFATVEADVVAFVNLCRSL